MGWKLIKVSGDEETARLSATALIEKLGAAYRRAAGPEGLPNDVEVYRCVGIAHPPAFVLSGAAFQLLSSLGLGFAGVETDEPADRSVFVKIEL